MLCGGPTYPRVVVGENLYFVLLHGEKDLELFVVLPHVQEKLVKLVSVHAEDGEHLELVGSVSDVHSDLRGHCQKTHFVQFFTLGRVRRHNGNEDCFTTTRLFKLLRINFLGTIYNCFFCYISLLTYKAHCVGRTSFYCTNFKIISEKLPTVSNSPTFETIPH